MFVDVVELLPSRGGRPRGAYAPISRRTPAARDYSKSRKLFTPRHAHTRPPPPPPVDYVGLRNHIGTRRDAVDLAITPFASQIHKHAHPEG
ncbi:hypothetical protein EVAR_28301_1 [Eumeta japonica]|uniref:Uncharacterized protein n=1 Tax=Eumeta variegata TaxID=151549 RepID=A0A4C1V8F5_EUMVA|nr:hypothetical protein EVAR_28301_1 [Eumeta japonica]